MEDFLTPELALWLLLAALGDELTTIGVEAQLSSLVTIFLVGKEPRSGTHSEIASPSDINVLKYRRKLLALMQVTAKGMITIRQQSLRRQKLEDAKTDSLFSVLQQIEGLSLLSGSGLTKSVAPFVASGTIAATGAGLTTHQSLPSLSGFFIAGGTFGLVAFQLLLALSAAIAKARIQSLQDAAEVAIWRSEVKGKLTATCRLFLIVAKGLSEKKPNGVTVSEAVIEAAKNVDTSGGALTKSISVSDFEISQSLDPEVELNLEVALKLAFPDIYRTQRTENTAKSHGMSETRTSPTQDVS